MYITSIKLEEPSLVSACFHFFTSPCSHTLSSRWVTLAEHIKTQTFVLRNLKPATVYLFMVRAVNAYGLSDPSPISDSVRTQGQCVSFSFLFALLHIEQISTSEMLQVYFSCYLTSFLPFLSTDSTSTMQGVDPRHIQRELGDVIIHLHTPTVLSSSAVRVQWMVRGPCHDDCPTHSQHFLVTYTLCRS